MLMFYVRGTARVVRYVLTSPVVQECAPVRGGSPITGVRGSARDFCDPASQLHPVGIG